MSRYEDIEIRRDSTEKPGKRFYSTTLYPEVPLSENDIYVITVQGDRLDLLANQYYGDWTLYWIIGAANDNLSKNSIHIPEGLQIRIPTDIVEIVNNFNSLNSR
jgi:phage tail protein X